MPIADERGSNISKGEEHNSSKRLVSAGEYVEVQKGNISPVDVRLKLKKVTYQSLKLSHWSLDPVREWRMVRAAIPMHWARGASRHLEVMDKSGDVV